LDEALDVAFAFSRDHAPLGTVQEALGTVLDQLQPDCNFGELHTSKLHAVSCVAHALAAATSSADLDAASAESMQAAGAEVQIVKGAFYLREGSYDGVYNHPSFKRELKWQIDDLAALTASEEASDLGGLRRRAIDQGSELIDSLLRNEWPDVL